MGLSNRIWQVAAVEYTIDAVTSVFGALTNASIDSNTIVEREITGGKMWPTAASLTGVDPTATFGTLRLREAISSIGTLAKCVDPNSDLVSLYVKRRECNLPGDNHAKYAIDAGVISPQSLTVQHRQNAEYTALIYAVADSSNSSPVILTTNSALPAMPADIGDRFTMGPSSTIAGNAIEGKISVNIDFGNDVRSESSDSEVYPTFAGVMQSIPKVTISGINPEWFNDVIAGLSGADCTQLDTILYFQKRGASLIAAEHISAKISGFSYSTTTVEGTAGDTAGMTIDIDPITDGTNAPIEFAVDQTIPETP